MLSLISLSVELSAADQLSTISLSVRERTPSGIFCLSVGERPPRCADNIGFPCVLGPHQGAEPPGLADEKARMIIQEIDGRHAVPLVLSMEGEILEADDAPTGFPGSLRSPSVSIG